MIAEIVAVGTEILLGDIVNTNACFLSRRLAAVGVDVYHHVVVGDNPGRMAAAFRQALGRSDLVVVSGGLGPTEDDLSKEVMAEVLGLPLDFDAAVMAGIEDFFRKRRRPLTPNARKQALVPRGATVLPNPVGTAPGLFLEAGGKMVFLLPGPPGELGAVWEQHAEPLLRRLGVGGQVILSRTLKVCAMGESQVAHLVGDLFASSNPTVAPYAKPGEVHLRVTAKASGPEQARELMAPLEAEIRRRLGWRVFAVDDGTMAHAVGERLVAAGLTLAVAESCTGGMLGALITTVPGSSRYFLGGIVAYANQVKVSHLDVPGELIRERGAVSEEVAGAMAAGVRNRLGADVSLAISGVAGPGGGSPAKPVGTVCFALARPEGLFTWSEFLRGDREEVRGRACQVALTTLYRYLVTGNPEGE
ncbi:MAG: competence/damage-inducible protein A [Firmicutes bacterium]|nr:competence/damage-inducible protein A [Bacillota bacterium]